MPLVSWDQRGTSDILPPVLEVARRLIRAEACAIWRRDLDTHEWRIVAAEGLSETFITASCNQHRAGDMRDEPLCLEDVLSSPRMAARWAILEAEGIASMLVMPLKIRGKNSGTIVLYYRQRHQFSADEVQATINLANLTAAAIENGELYKDQERLRTEAERARQRASFVAEASTVLASSLAYEATLATVARLAVPHIADWCVVDMVQEDGSLRELALVHVDPAKAEWAHELRNKYAGDSPLANGAAKVVRTGKPELAPEIPDRLLAAVARNPEHLAQLKQAGLTSYMCVPLKVREHVLGAMSFITGESGRHYGPEDMALALDLARRAAIAVDHARLFAASQRERAALESAMVALRDKEERLRMALDAGRMGIWDWNIVTGDLQWTENLVPLHGFLPGEFDGRLETFISVIHPDDRPVFDADVARAIQEKSYFGTEFRVVYRDGSVHWMSGSGKVYCDQNGNPVRMIGLGMDVTERRRLEEKLRKSQKLEGVGLLAGGVAHDFNNLLTGILGNASLALDMLAPDSPPATLLQNVVQACERAADLTRQLLAYSGKGKFVIEQVDLSALVRQICGLLQASIPKMVKLVLHLASGLPYIEGDPSQLQQVVMNLVINAAEAIGERAGSVVVETGIQNADEGYIHEHFSPDELRPGQYIYLQVHDDGCGIDQEMMGRIFEPFFSTKFTGRGLGLAAVAGAVRGHRGAIRVRSSPGTGSTFLVLFPKSEAPVPKHFGGPMQLEGAPGTGLVLVVDDEETVRSAAEATLRHYGYSVAIAEDGQLAVERFRERAAEFSAVLLDLTMPVQGGADTMRRIKEIRPDIPVIASSGYSEVEAYRRFPAGELAGFLQKPYSGVALARKIQEALAPQRASKAAET
ncbi:MAG TPA: GAF domain-containing protein [Bryobacteraceae bacterium]|nr:GAF domain-containing protein [Bryobacteraceae bacterium]